MAKLSIKELASLASHVWSNSSLLEIGPSSTAEERVCVVSKHGCY